MNSKETKYQRLLQQVEELIVPVKFTYSRMATINAVLYHKMQHFYWVGYYLLDDQGNLNVGPYQGTLACLNLKKSTGVCWAGINQKKTLIVPDVHEFEGHIACDPKSQSEIVVPLYNNNLIIGVLDIDSDKPNQFDETDRKYLELFNKLIFS